MISPNIWENKKMFQTTNQIWYTPIVSHDLPWWLPCFSPALRSSKAFRRCRFKCLAATWLGADASGMHDDLRWSMNILNRKWKQIKQVNTIQTSFIHIYIYINIYIYIYISTYNIYTHISISVNLVLFLPIFLITPRWSNPHLPHRQRTRSSMKWSHSAMPRSSPPRPRSISLKRQRSTSAGSMGPPWKGETLGKGGETWSSTKNMSGYERQLRYFMTCLISFGVAVVTWSYRDVLRTEVIHRFQNR